ncbi:MAG: hypothetical protein UT55_C0084G0001 [Candidatus Peregrinibacteria bacterium GW2011_GWE2_39_6]|nr:MAG: hypothetical protein UT55_C0084G0001 [Candidatus Peregrinibacteria bacterium GW2011_GWE2_39_6]
MGLLGIGLMLLALVSITKNPILFMDSQSYLNISLKVQSMNLVHLSNTPSFPFLLAIFYSDLSVIVFFQTIFSVLAWTFLGVVLASLLNSKFLKSLVVLIFILFPFTNLIWPWDYNILTESLNLSTYAVILGLIINLTKRYLNPLNFNIPLNYKDHILSLIAVFLIGTLFSFTRDANMIIDQIFVFYFIGIALILFFLRKITKKIKIVHFLFPAIIAIIFGGIYFLHSFDLKKSPRSLVPITHGLFSIFQENTEYKQFFIDRGMPIEPFLLDLENPSAEITWENFQKNQDYQKWIKNDALNEYKLFLLKHPFFVFERLKKELPYLINPLGSYGYRFSPLEIKKIYLIRF